MNQETQLDLFKDSAFPTQAPLSSWDYEMNAPERYISAPPNGVTIIDFSEAYRKNKQTYHESDRELIKMIMNRSSLF